MEFNRLFGLLLGATTLWSCMALATTGQLHAWVFVLVLPFLLLPMLGLASRVRISTLWSTLLTLTAFLLALFSLFVLREVMFGIVYFFLYLTVLKAWTLHRNRDVFQLLVLTFFLMVAASVMTAAISFGLMFIGYAVLLTATWILFSIRRDALTIPPAEKKKRSRGGAFRRPRPVFPAADVLENRLGSARILSRGFVLTLVSLGLATICGSVGLFFIIPRLSAQQMLAGFGTARPQSVSGFSEQVDFRSLGSIQLDPTIIGRVRLPLLASIEERPSYLRLRGTSLDAYTGRQWRKSAAAYSRQWPATLAEFYFAEDTPRGERIIQEVILEPDGGSYLFGASMPIHYRFDRAVNVVLDRISFSVQAPRAREQTLRYVVNSYLPPPILDGSPVDRPLRNLMVKAVDSARRLPADLQGMIQSGRSAVNSPPPAIRDTSPGPTDPLFQSLLPSMRMPRPGRFDEQHLGATSRGRQTASALPTNLRRLFLQMPELADLQTVERLAREWTAEALTPLQQARIIERKLRTEYGYTTDIQITNPERHLTEFLTVRREGHCEYFATAMTLMLRKLGIPARLVTGYYTDEWNASGGYFLLRRQHAHSWVEAWLDPHGWVTFEPSPASGVGANRIPSALFRRVQQWLDTMRYLWYRNVIDFDIRDQFILARRMREFRLTGGIHQFLAQIRVGGANLALRRMGLSPGRILGLALLGILAVALLGFLVRELFRGGKARRNGNRHASRSSLEQIQFYLELLRTLAALRYLRPRGQTPLEYARQLVREHAEWADFLPITQSYYQVRYRREDVPDELLERARRLLERIRHAPRGGNTPSSKTGAA